jgi:tetratricopeptide (TPR) repeat protein
MKLSPFYLRVARRTRSVFRCRALASLAVVAALTAYTGCAQKTRTPVEGEKVLTHEVTGDETLESIADTYYGDPDRGDEIRKFNLLESDELAAGDVVRVYMNPEDMEALAQRKRARVPYNAGLNLAAQGAYLEAITEFKVAVDLDPDFAEARYNLGVTFQKLDAHEKAVEQFERAISLRSKNPDYHYAMGNSYFHLQRYDRASREFERALKLNANHLKSQYSLAASLEKSGNTTRARREWRRYLELDGDSEWAERARARLAELEP